MPYLTPDSAPAATVCRTLVIPDDVNWISIVNGALSELIHAYRFEQFGTATPDEVADVFRTMFYDYLVSACMNGQLLISPQDTTPGYLQDKLLAGPHTTLTKNNAGANESLTVATDPALRTVRLDFTWLIPNPQLIATLPAGALLKDVIQTIDAPFDGDYIARIGIPGDVGLFMAAADNYPAASGVYITSPNYRCLDITEVYLFTTHSGATQGAGRVTLIVED